MNDEPRLVIRNVKPMNDVTINGFSLEDTIRNVIRNYHKTVRWHDVHILDLTAEIVHELMVKMRLKQGDV